MVSRILELHSAYIGLPACSSWTTAFKICLIVESLASKLYVSVLQNNYGHTQFFLFAIDLPIVGNNNRSSVENQDTEEVTQPLEITKETAKQNRLQNHRYQYVLIKAYSSPVLPYT